MNKSLSRTLILLFLAVVYVFFIYDEPIELPCKPPQDSFYFIRHGQTDANKFHIVQGSLNVPLNATGKAQAEAAAQQLKNLPIETIVTSNLKRARETAAIIADVLNKPVIVVDGLEERSVGVMEGKSHGLWFYGWALGKLPIKRAESVKTFYLRVSKALCNVFQLPGPLLIVAHGGTYHVINEILHPGIFDYIQNAKPVLYQAPKDSTKSWQIISL